MSFHIRLRLKIGLCSVLLSNLMKGIISDLAIREKVSWQVQGREGAVGCQHTRAEDVYSPLLPLLKAHP